MVVDDTNHGRFGIQLHRSYDDRLWLAIRGRDD